MSSEKGSNSSPSGKVYLWLVTFFVTLLDRRTNTLEHFSAGKIIDTKSSVFGVSELNDSIKRVEQSVLEGRHGFKEENLAMSVEVTGVVPFPVRRDRGEHREEEV